MYNNVLLISGTRNIVDKEIAECAIHNYGFGCLDGDSYKNLLIHGGARGIDQLSEKVVKSFDYCIDEEWGIKVFNANWNEHGLRAGSLRNIEMGKYFLSLESENKIALCIPGKESKGTWHMFSWLASKAPTNNFTLILCDWLLK